ncbi:hypothetical protein [Paenibacillus macerans]|uniref:hypothetical protein n=1 Tax=Paenibacillus macerans TaxID=44252 RepID=UPI000EEC538D|nr:hypothetical protein [Paenibacillus macerans]GBK62516.1 hypothetical protein PbDSM24746_25200 [Paenibacillus macerans]GBK68828.1 hypothetical protein PbJCM17693_25360 [Paenibacillus macerans]GIP08402.1 hypothetical protein J1TS5_05720 [Paenibacillus macerans]
MNSNRKKKITALALASLLSISLAACGSGGSGSGSGSAAGGENGGNGAGGKKVTIELAISKSSQDSAFIQQDLLDEFEQKTNIHVNLQLIPAEQTTTVLQTKLAVEETPDIIQYNLARSELYRLLQDQFAGGLTPEEVLKAWDEKFSQLMKDKEVPGF